MNKKIIAIISLFTVVSVLCACGKNSEHKSQITDTTPNSTADNTENAAQATVLPTIDPSVIAQTLAPMKTPDPDASKKAEEKIAKDGSANAVVADGENTHEVDLEFTLGNYTGIDFPMLLLAPATEDLLSTANILPENFTFANDSAITLNPAGDEASPTLNTSLFNIGAVDSSNRVYVFQNIDLAACNTIGLYITDGKPTARVE